MAIETHAESLQLAQALHAAMNASGRDADPGREMLRALASLPLDTRRPLPHTASSSVVTTST